MNPQLFLDDALAQVEQNADQLWLEAAVRIVKRICETTPEFTTDALHAELAKTMHSTREKRALGAVMRKAAHCGWCENTSRVEKSKRPECHKRPVAVWRSLIYPTFQLSEPRPTFYS